MLCHVSYSASVFLTVAITIERFFAVCRPLQYQARVTEKGHYCILLQVILSINTFILKNNVCFQYVVPAVFTAILLNLPKLLHISQVVFTLYSSLLKNFRKNLQIVSRKLELFGWLNQHESGCTKF